MAQNKQIQVKRPMDRAIATWSQRGYLLVHSSIKENLSGKVLRIDSGRLINSVDLVSRIRTDGFDVGTNVVYGIAWEFGFTRKEFRVLPKNKKVLHWKKGGKDFFSRGHIIPAQHFPARPWLQPAIHDNFDPLRSLLGEEVKREFEAANQGIEIEVNVI